MNVERWTEHFRQNQENRIEPDWNAPPVLPPAASHNHHDKPFTFSGRIRSVEHAVHGIIAMVRSQPNTRIHGAATILVLLLGVICGLARWEWCWIVSAIAAVWTAEGFNSALEHLADVVFPHHHPGIGTAKDMAAGAVLICSMGAAVIGLLIISPHLAGLRRMFFTALWMDCTR